MLKSLLIHWKFTILLILSKKCIKSLSFKSIIDGVKFNGFMLDYYILASVIVPFFSCKFGLKIYLSYLNSFTHGISSSGSELKWLLQMLDCRVPRELLSYGRRRVFDAFHLLRTDPSVKVPTIKASSRILLILILTLCVEAIYIFAYKPFAS